MTRLILASGSPRRRELLAHLGVPFEVAPADVDEAWRSGEPAEDLVRRLAVEKAQAVAANAGDDVVVLAADTVVVLDGDVLGKPSDADDAAAMLARLAGRLHVVLTGVAVARAAGGAAGIDVEVVATEVFFDALTPEDIAWYVATGEPLDKAGAYGIQGVGGTFVASIRGSFDNVVGLPMAVARRMLADAGVGLGQPPEV